MLGGRVIVMNVENLDRLIGHLASLDDSEFSMAHTNRKHHPCGTACCIAGHISELAKCSLADASDWLDWRRGDWGNFICTEGWDNETDSNKRYPLSRALRMLRHMRSEYIRTGKVVVDWDAPEQADRKPWSAPVVTSADKPLPAEIVRLLSDQRLEVLQ